MSLFFGLASLKFVGKVAEARDQEPLAVDALDHADNVHRRDDDPDRDREQTTDASRHRADDGQQNGDDDVGSEQHEAVLRVPLDVLIVLFGQERDQGEWAEVGEDDHQRAVARVAASRPRELLRLGSIARRRWWRGWSVGRRRRRSGRIRRRIGRWIGRRRIGRRRRSVGLVAHGGSPPGA